MYKKQMTMQKLLCLAAIIVSAILFLYSLGIMTDLYDSLYTTMRDPNLIDDGHSYVDGAHIYYDMQPFNQTLLMCSIGMILLAVLLYVTNTHIRRRYYIGNFFSIGVYTVASIAVSVYGHSQLEAFKSQFKAQVNLTQLKEYAEEWGTHYSGSTTWFDLHYLALGLLLLVSVLLVINAIWKVNLMKDEANIVKEGRRAAT